MNSALFHIPIRLFLRRNLIQVARTRGNPKSAKELKWQHEKLPNMADSSVACCIHLDDDLDTKKQEGLVCGCFHSRLPSRDILISSFF